MAQAAKAPRHNRTITVDFHDEATYSQLLGNTKAFIEFVLAFILSIGAGCEFSVAQTLLACAPVEGNNFIKARCGQNNACGSVAAHGRECACPRCFFVHTLLISCPGVCQFCPTTSRRSSDVQNLQPAPSLVDGRRKKLFPNLRRFVVDFDLKVSEGRVARNVLSESMSAQ
jgi:hypothetical protein